MSEAPTYPINSLIEISRIPEEAIPRFLSEFPLIISSVRSTRVAIEKLDEAAGMGPISPAQWAEITDGFCWVDDDKGDIRVGITLVGDDGSKHQLVSIEGNCKTGKFSANVDIPAEDAE